MLKTGSGAFVALVLLVALLHLAFAVLEMFFWDHPVGQQIFAMTPTESAASALLAANQGFYNAVLATGLIWGLAKDKRDLIGFLLVFVVLVGIFGGATVKASILFTQALPAALALLAMRLGKSSSS